jgi:hydroxymethylbilane synthase
MDNSKKDIIIGTRGSELALKQAEIVRVKLIAIDKNLEVEIKIIKTEGDINQAPIPLDVVGKGWFTKEIETALLKKEIDIAVHSLKDLPEDLPKGLMLGAYPEREDPRDCLVSKNNVKLRDLSKGAIVGTDSLRRKVQVLAIRGDLIVKSIRGNVPTRVKKMDEGQFDAVILAVAGLKRLNLEDRIAEYFEPNVLTPAPGQGILAVEIRKDDEEIRRIVGIINDDLVGKSATIEREFSAMVGGGCKAPVGAYASCTEKECRLIVMVAEDENSKIIKKSIIFPIKDYRAQLKRLILGLKEKL